MRKSITRRGFKNPNKQAYDNLIQQIIKDLENVSLSDIELLQKYANQAYDLEFKRLLIDTKIDQNECSILHWAAKYKRTKFITFLINEFNLDINIRCKKKQTPLHYFINNNIILKKDVILEENLNEKVNLFKDAFQIFYENSCDFNLQDENGLTALHFAANINNYFGAVSLLFVPDIKININDINHATALHLAFKQGNEDLALLFINQTDSEALSDLIVNDLTDGIYLPLHLACRHKNEKLEIVKSYLYKIFDNKNFQQCIYKEDKHKQTILHISIENNHINIVELLFRNFAINTDLRESQDGNLPIHSAAKNGSLEMFSLLQKYDAVSFETNKNMENALHIASSHNRSKFISEFLKYEKAYINSDENERFVKCACACRSGETHVSCKKGIDNRNFTPLLTALATCNQRCVEELIDDEEESNPLDLNGNTMYHVCAKYDNFESLKYLFLKTNEKNDVSLFAVKNSLDETILHLSSRNGNLEMTNFIFNKMHESNSNLDELVYNKNNNGQTCFHIAAGKGFFNLIEYFLKKKKLYQFLHHVDNDLNTGLHLATSNGHSSVVRVLLENGSDPNAKNADKLTPLDISCRKGFFEIGKLLLESSDLNFDNTLKPDGEYPLHFASRQGEFEIVKLLLDKGARIDQLNSKKLNCLDLAIESGNHDLIRILLNDPNWLKLMRVNNTYINNIVEENNFKIVIQDDSNISNEDTFVLLYKAKMWDVYEIILEKCKINEKEMNFSILDPSIKSFENHPLLLIARSGQENLIKHDTTTKLLELKWRHLPKTLFILNVCFYALYLLLFSWYTVEISTNNIKSNILKLHNSSSSNSNINSTNIFSSKLLTEDLGDEIIRKKIRPTLVNYKFRGFHSYSTKDSFPKETPNQIITKSKDDTKPEAMFIVLMTVVVIQLIREVIQLLVFDGISYFFSIQNLFEVFTYSFSLCSIIATNYNDQSFYGSISILFSYMLFPLFLQKLDMIGIYVVAMLRTLTNSAKLFPVFLLLFIGFLFSFRLRTSFGVSYSQTDSLFFSFFRTITMAVGELDTSKMGLDENDSNSLPNYIIYFLFLILMCTIVLNLFVGIAVGEIKTTLDEASVQLICMRISFCLKIQANVDPMIKRFKCLKEILNMNFKIYNYEQENKIFKMANKFWTKLVSLVKPNEQPIELIDPTKRLENSLEKMSIQTNDQIRSVKSCFSTQIIDIESKLLNAQRRLQDSLIEFSDTTLQQINEIKQETKNMNTTLRKDLDKIQKVLEESSGDLNYTNKYFNIRFTESEQAFKNQIFRLEAILVELTEKSLFQYESVKETCINERKSIKDSIKISTNFLEEFVTDLVNKLTKSSQIKSDDNSEDKIKSFLIESFKQSNSNNELSIQSQKTELELMINNFKNLFIETIKDFNSSNQVMLNELKNELLNEKALNNSSN